MDPNEMDIILFNFILKLKEILKETIPHLKSKESIKEKVEINEKINKLIEFFNKNINPEVLDNLNLQLRAYNELLQTLEEEPPNILSSIILIKIYFILKNLVEITIILENIKKSISEFNISEDVIKKLQNNIQLSKVIMKKSSENHEKSIELYRDNIINIPKMLSYEDNQDKFQIFIYPLIIIPLSSKVEKWYNFSFLKKVLYTNEIKKQNRPSEELFKNIILDIKTNIKKISKKDIKQKNGLDLNEIISLPSFVKLKNTLTIDFLNVLNKLYENSENLKTNVNIIEIINELKKLIFENKNTDRELNAYLIYTMYLLGFIIEQPDSFIDVLTRKKIQEDIQKFVDETYCSVLLDYLKTYDKNIYDLIQSEKTPIKILSKIIIPIEKKLEQEINKKEISEINKKSEYNEKIMILFQWIDSYNDWLLSIEQYASPYSDFIRNYLNILNKIREDLELRSSNFLNYIENLIKQNKI